MCGGGGGGIPPRRSLRIEKLVKKTEWRKSGPIDTITESLIEIGELCTQVMAKKQEAKQKQEVPYPSWICSNNVRDRTPGIGCDGCGAWVYSMHDA